MTPTHEPATTVGAGLVVVSHSRALANAAVALAAEMVHGRGLRVAVAAGLDERTFGTDAVQIKTAIEQVDGPDGVVVLMDLGSAVLSAELALDLLEDRAVRSRVLLCAAPLVEGLVVAAVAAAGGAAAAEVAAEARDALMGKSASLGMGGPGPLDRGDHGEPVTAEFTVANAHGLHARPAARLVADVRRLDATVRLRNLTTGSEPVPASSLSRVATLGALRGHRVQVQGFGPQAREAVDHLLALAARRFDEDEQPPAAAPSHAADVTAGSSSGTALAASPGIGMGPVRHPLQEAAVAEDPAAAAGPPAAQWRRVVEAVADVRRELERLRAVTARDVGSQEAAIFDAHLLLLADAELLGDVKRSLDEGHSAAAAWSAAVGAVQRQWSELPDPYMKARADDVRAVGDQVLRALTGAAPARIDAEGVLVARDLTPAQAAELDPGVVKAVVLAGGTPTSHVAIIARALGIPAVVAAGQWVLSLPEGTQVIVDGDTAQIVVEPAPDVREQFEERAAHAAASARADLAAAASPAATRDGVVVQVAANVGSVAEARTALSTGADLVGLLRTEFLFLSRDRAPDVAEQEQEYLAVAAAMQGRRLTIRTLDAGGDKPLAYLGLVPEENPFLGLRGVRLTLARPHLFAEQLTAVCRVARHTPVDLLLPMVATVAELHTARAALAAAARSDSGQLPAGLRVGMMVEVPAAALAIESFVPHLDFVSVGTNDLTQYTMAAERGNPAVSYLADALEPAVLRLIDLVCRACADRIPVAVCGEAASDPVAIPVLLGLGVRELSVTPLAVPAVKRAVRELDLDRCTQLASAALQADGAAGVRELVGAAAQLAHAFSSVDAVDAGAVDVGDGDDLRLRAMPMRPGAA